LMFAPVSWGFLTYPSKEEIAIFISITSCLASQRIMIFVRILDL
jgi:hypothetical protein